jgi:regulator of protease activity HflC (stomatin/prohibitin superfamily)
MEAVQTRMRELVQQQDLGITIDHVNPQTSPPLALQKDFERFTDALQQGADSSTKANSYRSTVVGSAVAAAETRVKVAQAASARMVALVAAEQTNFSRLLPYYQKNPDLVKTQLLADAVKKALLKSALTEVVPDLEGRQLRVLLSPPETPLYSSPTNQPTPGQ